MNYKLLFELLLLYKWNWCNCFWWHNLRIEVISQPSQVLG